MNTNSTVCFSCSCSSVAISVLVYALRVLPRACTQPRLNGSSVMGPCHFSSRSISRVHAIGLLHVRDLGANDVDLRPVELAQAEVPQYLT